MTLGAKLMTERQEPSLEDHDAAAASAEARASA